MTERLIGSRTLVSLSSAADLPDSRGLIVSTRPGGKCFHAQIRALDEIDAAMDLVRPAWMAKGS